MLSESETAVCPPSPVADDLQLCYLPPSPTKGYYSAIKKNAILPLAATGGN